MTRRPPQRRPHPMCLHLLLALALFLAPLLVQAQVMQRAGADSDTMQQMPCHSQDTALDAHSPQRDCGHCSDDAPVQLCLCGQVAPAGLIGPLPAAPARLARPGQHRTMAPDTLPDSPDEALFRPPIPAAS